MCEYVCIPYGLTIDGRNEGEYDRRERVIRCRDCAFAQNGGTRCLYWSHKDSATSKVAMPYVDPRGFCAWGKERDA